MHRPTPFAVRAYAAVIRLYPRRLRARVASEPVDLFATMWRDERPGPLARQCWWIAAVFGRACWALATAHLTERRDPRHRSPRRRWLAAFLSETRYAARRLRKHPASTVMSILALAISIGAGVAAWTLISAVLIHPLPVAGGDDRLVAVDSYVRGNDGNAQEELRERPIYPEIVAWRDAGLFADVAAAGTDRVIVADPAGSAYRDLHYVTPNLFELLGVRTQQGRPLRPDDDRRGAPLVAVLTDAYWRAVFNRDSQVVGRTLTINKQAVMIVGVAMPGFRGVDLQKSPDVFLPLQSISTIHPVSNWFAEPAPRFSPTAWLRAIARLRDDATAEQTTARLNERRAGLSPRVSRFVLTPLQTAVVPARLRSNLASFGALLGATVSLLLLIGGLTVSMLVLLRTEARRSEFALCRAIGAGRWRLAAGVVAEGALLSGTGAVLALPIGRALLAGLGTFSLPGEVPIERLMTTSVAPGLAAAAAAAIVGTLLIALVAGVAGSSVAVGDALRLRVGATATIGRPYTRAMLVVAQVAIAVVLLAGLGLFVRSLIKSLQLNPGYDTARIVNTDLRLFPQGYSQARAARFFADLDTALSSDPEIAGFALSQEPVGMSAGGEVGIDGEKRRMPSYVAYHVIDPRFFPTIGLRIVEGRDFAATDVGGGPPVAIVTESFARLIGGRGSAIGHRVENMVGRDRVATIVGVVPDVVTSVRWLDPLAVYVPQPQASTQGFSRNIHIRPAGDVAAAKRRLAAVLRQIDPGLVLPPIETMAEQIAGQMGPQRFGATVLGALGLIALMLTLFGIYVLAESMSALRRRELGVRAALGATRAQLTSLVVGQTTRLIGAGVAVGLVFVWLGGGLIRSFLFNVRETDMPTLAVVSVAMLALTMLTGLRPALRAGRFDVARVLRDE